MVRDKTFRTFCRLVWDCPEDEFVQYANKLMTGDPVHSNGGGGKTVIGNNKDLIEMIIWIKNRNDLETLSHEILHMIRWWLQDFYEIDLSEETEEIYTMLHSFYFNRFAKALGLKKYTYPEE